MKTDDQHYKILILLPQFLILKKKNKTLGAITRIYKKKKRILIIYHILHKRYEDFLIFYFYRIYRKYSILIEPFVQKHIALLICFFILFVLHFQTYKKKMKVENSFCHENIMLLWQQMDSIKKADLYKIITWYNFCMAGYM